MKTTIKYLIAALFFCNGLVCLAQKKKELPKHEKEALQFVFDGNDKLLKGNVLEGEKSYRKAIAKDPNSGKAKYNLGYSYYKTKSFQEAVQRNKQAAALAKNKAEKHIAYHNLGNSYLQMQKPDEAIEAYKNALRNNPMDDETRYNLAVAKQAKKQQDQQNKDQNKDQKNSKDNKDGKDKEDKKDQDKKDENENKDNKDKKEDENKKDEADKDKDKKDEDKDADEKDKEDKDAKDKKDKDGDKGDEKEEKEKQPRPGKGKLSPDQVKSLLEAMENQEKKVQDKINAQKVRGPKVKSDKDW
ncbi:tetratricopeptide repeat protein [Aquimarina agarilytica]|uniref:tetratricopeptide repeat protein n=1 Tax=Aquimarina agarilytica TaxID=1087449 RepID=UPI0002886652|nr:tetratricopeptide repeat protein [Aquimarina agarilytica]